MVFRFYEFLKHLTCIKFLPKEDIICISRALCATGKSPTHNVTGDQHYNVTNMTVAEKGYIDVGYKIFWCQF